MRSRIAKLSSGSQTCDAASRIASSASEIHALTSSRTRPHRTRFLSVCHATTSRRLLRPFSIHDRRSSAKAHVARATRGLSSVSTAVNNANPHNAHGTSSSGEPSCENSTDRQTLADAVSAADAVSVADAMSAADAMNAADAASAKHLSRDLSTLAQFSPTIKTNATGSSYQQLMKYLQLLVPPPMRCPLCPKRFASDLAYQKHMRLRHESGAQPHDDKLAAASRWEPLECPTCGDRMCDRNNMSEHLASLGVDHDSQGVRGHRAYSVSQEDLNSAEQFFNAYPVLDQKAHHDTTLSSRSSIQESSRLDSRPGISPIHLGPLADDDAPSSVHFHLHPENLDVSPLTSHFPQSAEPGEETAKLMIDMDSIMKSSEEGHPKIFFVGLYLTTFGPIYRANATVVVCVTRTSEQAQFLRESGGIELDPQDNRLLYRDQEKKRWLVATRARAEADTLRGWRPMRVVLSVCSDIELTPQNHEWQRIFRSHPDGSKYVCPICHKSFANLTEHLRITHGSESGTSPEFQCHLCGQITRYKRSLTRHLVYAHPEHYPDQQKQHRLSTSTRARPYAFMTPSWPDRALAALKKLPDAEGTAAEVRAQVRSIWNDIDDTARDKQGYPTWYNLVTTALRRHPAVVSHAGFHGRNIYIYKGEAAEKRELRRHRAARRIVSVE